MGLFCSINHVWYLNTSVTEINLPDAALWSRVHQGLFLFLGLYFYKVGASEQRNSENIHLKCLHLGIVWLRFVYQNIPPGIYYTRGIFWHKQIVANCRSTNFGCQNIPPVYLCVVEYVCLLHRTRIENCSFITNHYHFWSNCLTATTVFFIVYI